MQEVWGPDCGLTVELRRIRSLTVGARGEAGFMKIEAELQKQLEESQGVMPAREANFETFNKATVQAILEGRGAKPSWARVWSLATALRRLARVEGDAASGDSLRDLWNRTSATAPALLTVHHDALRTFGWAQRQEMGQRRWAVGRDRRLTEGAVSLGRHVARSAGFRYDVVFDLDSQRDLTQLMEEPFLRDGVFTTHTEYTETGFKVWGPINKGSGDELTSFVCLEATDRGVVSVYFRWSAQTFPSKNRWGAKTPIEWGLMGARHLVLDAHRLLGFRGAVQAAVFAPKLTGDWPQGPRNSYSVSTNWMGEGGLAVSEPFELGQRDAWDESWQRADVYLRRFLLGILSPQET